MSDLEEAYRQIPPVTRVWLTVSFLTTCAIEFGMLNAAKIVWWPQRIYSDFEVWRLITPFFFMGGFGMNFVFTLIFLTKYSSALEANTYSTTQGAYRGGTADFLFMWLMCGFTLEAIIMIAGGGLIGPPLVFSILYVWSKKNPLTPVNLWGLNMKAPMLPWALLVLQMLMGGSIQNDLMGIGAGHVYFTLVEVLPLKYQRQFLFTPQFLIEFCDWVEGTTTFHNTPNGQAVIPPRGFGGHVWGQGRTLGHEE